MYFNFGLPGDMIIRYLDWKKIDKPAPIRLQLMDKSSANTNPFGKVFYYRQEIAAIMKASKKTKKRMWLKRE